MAHFAKIENGIVTQVIVVANSDTASADGTEKEYIGQAFCERLFGGDWKQTSYNSNFRKNYAGIGFSYDEGRNAFIPPKPFASWTLNETTCQWDAPTPMPTDGKHYQWDESTTSWIEVQDGA
jgi:hypothetical protein